MKPNPRRAPSVEWNVTTSCMLSGGPNCSGNSLATNRPMRVTRTAASPPQGHRLKIRSFRRSVERQALMVEHHAIGVRHRNDKCRTCTS
jgi:hypothetical protein